MGFLSNISNPLNWLSGDIAIDLGTANTLLWMKGKGVMINEPSIVARSVNDGNIIAVGNKAKAMLGRTHRDIETIRPLRDGVIADFDMTDGMLLGFIRMINISPLARMRMVICVPSGVTEVERRAVKDSGLRANAREVFLIEEPVAAAIGIGLDISQPIGNIIVDIGGGTTDIAIFTGGAIRHTAVIPIAGDQVTNDIAMALRTPTQNAEEIKIKYACALTQLAGAEETIKVPSVGDRPPRDLSRQALAEVVEPRYEELFTLIQSELRRSGFEELIAAGIVLTGGTSKMEGVVELAEEIFHMPVRLASPQGVTGLADIVNNPMYATGVGLLMYGLKQQTMESEPMMRPNGSEGIMEKIKTWFTGNF